MRRIILSVDESALLRKPYSLTHTPLFTPQGHLIFDFCALTETATLSYVPLLTTSLDWGYTI